VARLEARLAELERAQARRDRTEMANEQHEVIARLDRLIALNEQVLEREQSLSRALVPGVSKGSAEEREPITRTSLMSGLSFKEKLKALMLELRDDPSPWRGGLSPEQNQALRLLLRPERPLDSTNRWRAF
jgi:hypothetical protein